MYSECVNIRKKNESKEESSYSGTWPNVHQRRTSKTLPMIFREVKREEPARRPMRLAELLQKTTLEKSLEGVCKEGPELEQHDEDDISHSDTIEDSDVSEPDNMFSSITHPMLARDHQTKRTPLSDVNTGPRLDRYTRCQLSEGNKENVSDRPVPGGFKVPPQVDLAKRFLCCPVGLQPKAVEQPVQRLIETDSSIICFRSGTLVKNFMRFKDVDYVVHEKLGCGGSSEVFTVEHLATSQKFAVKCVDLTNVGEETSRCYLNEVQLLLRLQDKETVIKLFDHAYLKDQKRLYMLMELGETDLAKLIKMMGKARKIPVTIITSYWTEMLSAVKDIHDEGIVHADLKPANFLMVKGRLKLIDFGISSSVQVDMTSTFKDTPTGTYNYMSPEAIQDPGSSKCRSKIGYKSDVWSLGCILYNLLYGYTPFQHITNSWAKLVAIVNPKHAILFPETVQCSAVLRHALVQCLQYDPKRRPTVAALMELPYMGWDRALRVQ